MQSPTIVFKPFYINQITSEVITGIIPLRLQVYTKDLSQIETIKSRLVTQFQLDIENAVLVSPLSYATHELSI